MALRSFVPTALGVAAVVAAAATCSTSSSPTNSSAEVIAKAAASSGDGQTGRDGTLLPLPLRVVVTVNGVPHAGDTVDWAESAAGGSVDPTRSVTDANGVATTQWVLGATAGTDTATATLRGAAGSPVRFTATATAGPVPMLAKASTASGDAQTGVVASVLAAPLRVLVTLSGVPQAGDTVTWAVAAVGASVSPTQSVTDASGVAATTWTLGRLAGAQAATATLAGASGSPVSFSATAQADAATQLITGAGDGQSGAPSATLPTQLAAKVADQYGNAVAGVPVAWAVASGTASVNPPTATSDANGLAKTSVTLGGTAGPVTITATNAALANSPLSFSATIVVFATSAGVTVGDNFFRSARNNSQPAVDTIGAGGTVTWTWTGSNSHSVESTGSPGFASSTIKTSGTYSVRFPTAGTYTYDCAVHGSIMTGTVVVR